MSEETEPTLRRVKMGTIAMPAAPARSTEQRLEALERANAIRSYRKDLKVQMKRGERSAAWLLMDPPAEIESMRVFDLLLAIPKAGTVKVGKLLRFTEISPSKTVGGLSDRQRRELVTAVLRMPGARTSR